MPQLHCMILKQLTGSMT